MKRFTTNLSALHTRTRTEHSLSLYLCRCSVHVVLVYSVHRMYSERNKRNHQQAPGHSDPKVGRQIRKGRLLYQIDSVVERSWTRQQRKDALDGTLWQPGPCIFFSLLPLFCLHLCLFFFTDSSSKLVSLFYLFSIFSFFSPPPFFWEKKSFCLFYFIARPGSSFSLSFLRLYQ